MAQLTQDLKTYRSVHPENHGISFDLKRMQDIYAQHKGEADEPHRHDYFTVLIVQSASGQHIVDFQSYELDSQQVFFIHPGQVHQIVEHTEPQGYVITFTTAFLAKNGIRLDFIDDLNLFREVGDSPPLQPNKEEFNDIIQCVHQLEDIHLSKKRFKYEALGAALKLMLIQCNNLCGLPHSSELMGSGATLLKSYKNLINDNYSEWHGVREYADALHISADHLNRVVKSLTGKKAKEHIQNRIILAAKRMMYFTELSQKELAYRLGFSEAPHFSAFFKKHTGLSPSEFKKTAQIGYS